MCLVFLLFFFPLARTGGVMNFTNRNHQGRRKINQTTVYFAGSMTVPLEPSAPLHKYNSSVSLSFEVKNAPLRKKKEAQQWVQLKGWNSNHSQCCNDNYFSCNRHFIGTPPKPFSRDTQPCTQTQLKILKLKFCIITSRTIEKGKNFWTCLQNEKVHEKLKTSCCKVTHHDITAKIFLQMCNFLTQKWNEMAKKKKEGRKAGIAKSEQNVF